MKKSIFDELVEANRMLVLFVGSGISKRYLYGYPSWKELLEKSFLKYESDTYKLQKHIDECKRANKTEFETNAYLGTVIEKEFNEAFFERKFTLGIGNRNNPSWVKRGISPYKMYLVDTFKKYKLNKSPELRKEIEALRLLKNKISAVITTNYDNFLEKEVFNTDFQVFVHQDELFSSDSYNIAEIYKIHGSVTDAESIVITEDDYNHFKESRKLIIAKMLTLFAESPIVFMGYSLNDEDVREIIEEFLSCLSKTQLESIRKHFVFISHKKGEKKLLEIERTLTTINKIEIPFVEVQTDNFVKVYEMLNKITPGISPVRVRETRRLVKTIIDNNIAKSEPESIIVGIDDLDKVDLLKKPLAIAFGYRDSILSAYGYGSFSDKYIFEDIIFDNKKFDAEKMCDNRLNGIVITRLLPVYKYVKGRNISEDTKLYQYIQAHNSIDKIVTNKISKSLKNVEKCNDFDELIDLMKKTEVCRKAGMLLLKNIDILNINELRIACELIFNKYPDDFMADTNSKRCIMCLDLLENCR